MLIVGESLVSQLVPAVFGDLQTSVITGCNTAIGAFYGHPIQRAVTPPHKVLNEQHGWMSSEDDVVKFSA